VKFLVFQHIPIEHPGVFRDFMTAADITWDTVELDAGDSIPSLDGYDALIVMGGPMDVWQDDRHPWLIPEKAAIREAVLDRQLPYLGLCLGHQLLAVAAGGDVRTMKKPEVGVFDITKTAAASDDPLFSGLPDVTTALQWHSVEVSRLPGETVVLAQSPQCAIQAMRLGSHAYGVQYHVEITDQTVSQWAQVPAYKDALTRTIGPVGAAAMETEAAARMGEINTTARKLFGAFITLVREHRGARAENAA